MNFKNPAGVDMETLRALDYLQGPGEPDIYAELIGAFFARAPDDLMRIELAYAQNDTVKVSRIAHGLKSGAQILGALRFAEICFQLEHEAQNSAALVSLLKSEYELVRDKLNRFLKQQAGKKA